MGELYSAFLLLRLLVYAVHRCQHAVPFLWRFHALHHSDPDVDVTTSVRHHPIEYVMAASFYCVAKLALDIPAAVFVIHSLAVFSAAAVTHGNSGLPAWLERLLQPVVITLDLHLIHHSVACAEFNMNFGGVLSVWDRLFGTYRQLPRERLDRLMFGVAELPRAEGCQPWAMLLTPWRLKRAMIEAAAGRPVRVTHAKREPQRPARSGQVRRTAARAARPTLARDKADCVSRRRVLRPVHRREEAAQTVRGARFRTGAESSCYFAEAFGPPRLEDVKAPLSSDPTTILA